MTPAQLQDLRSKAEAATPGPWHFVDPNTDKAWSGETWASLRTVRKFGENKTEVRGGKTYTSWALPIVILGAESVEPNNAAFIAAANPATIIELLDTLASAEKRSEYWKAEHIAGNDIIERQRGVMQKVLGALVYHTDQTRPIERTEVAIAALQAELGEKE